MAPALCEFPNQPCLHGSEEKLAPFGALPHPLDMVENPRKLGCRKIGVQHKPGLLTDSVRMRRKTVTVIDGPAALPHDGAIHRATGLAVPYNRRLTLVRDSDGVNLLRRDSGLAHRLNRNAELRRPKFHRIVLNPARLRIILRNLLLRDAHNLAVMIENDSPLRCGSRIERHDKLFHKPIFLLPESYCCAQPAPSRINARISRCTPVFADSRKISWRMPG